MGVCNFPLLLAFFSTLIAEYHREAATVLFPWVSSLGQPSTAAPPPSRPQRARFRPHQGHCLTQRSHHSPLLVAHSQPWRTRENKPQQEREGIKGPKQKGDSFVLKERSEAFPFTSLLNIVHGLFFPPHFSGLKTTEASLSSASLDS